MVFVIHSDETIRHQIAHAANALGLDVRTFENNQVFLWEYSDTPGCVVTNLQDPVLNGLELQQQLCDRGHAIPVILLITAPTTPQVVAAMKRGIFSVLDPTESPHQVTVTIREAIEFDRTCRTQLSQWKAMDERMSQLSEGERAVMRLLVDGMANKQIARRLELSLRTIEARRHNLFKKLNVASIAELVRFVVAHQSHPLQPRE